jgi:hypothetical protein
LRSSADILVAEAIAVVLGSPEAGFFKRWSTAATAKQSVWIKTGCARRALFRHWAHYRDGTISRAALQRRLAPVRRAMERLLARGLQSGNRSLVGMCRIARAS